MDVFVIEQVIDLGGVNMPMIYRQALTQHDAYAHEWRVSIKRHGHAVDLTGCTAQIYFGPENRTGDGIEPGKAMTQSATAQGGAAYAKLLPELYQIDGRVMAIMQISDPEDHVMTAAVLRLHTSGVLEGDIGDPSGSVIELGALLAQLDELRTQTAAARDAAQTANTAAQSANDAASTAESQARAAMTAANRANNAADNANGMAAAANTAANDANTAAGRANTATGNANAATQASREQQQAVTEAETARDEAEEQRAKAETERDAAERARQETFDTYEDRLVAATPDDTTVDGRPWTSKKTVDALCLPFEATGNPVQVYPVEGYPLGVKVSWESVQEGEGDPSPDNIRPITGRDSVSVTRCGKNLYKNKGDLTVNGVTFTANDDGSITVNGTATEDTFYTVNRNIALQPGTYTLSGAPRTSNDAAYMYFHPGYPSDTGNGKTFTLEDAVDDFDVTIYVKKGYAADNIVFRPQLELGATATPYEPYTGSTTDIALPETVYGGTLDVETGVVTVEWVEKENKLGDTSLLDPVGNGFVRKTLPGISNVITGNANQKCNVAPYGYNFQGEYTHFYCEADGFNIIILPVDTPAETVIQISYRISVPYTIQLSPQQIAALSGVNTIYTGVGTLTVTGREDPRHTIVTLTDRIADLESAAAGV